MRPRIFIAALGALLGLAAGAAGAADIVLSLPLQCEVGKTCFVQNYVDHDPTTGARDYACGAQTYDAHDGTDFRLPNMTRLKEGVAVVAAADGRVMRLRDGMADISFRVIGRDALKGQDCGNGIAVRHSDGWETQYCHLAQGSIVVKPGDEVKAGQPLGRVGLSGWTEFAHLHLTVRKDGKAVDPFAYGAPEGACNAGTSLWDPKLQASLRYRPGAILNQGFADRLVRIEEIESGDAERAGPGADPAALVAFVRAIGLRKGDVQRIAIVGPDGQSVADHTASPLEVDEAQYFLAAGRKRPPTGWKPGAYRATYNVRRDGAVILEQSFEVTL